LAYDRLGLTDLRDDAKRILNQNFPGSRRVETVMKDEVATQWTLGSLGSVWTPWTPAKPKESTKP